MSAPDDQTADRTLPGPFDRGDLPAGRYRIRGLIGKGGTGHVYLAEQESIDRQLALKVLDTDTVGPSEVARFRREVFHASGLTHRHTVNVFDYGETDGGHLFIAMEYVPGPDLRIWLDGHGPMQIPMARRTTTAILDSLTEAHRHGIVHRDLKPENIILQGSQARPSELKVVDFGLSKYTAGDSPVEDDLRVTQDHVVYGTPKYMSPEQVGGREASPASDVYTVGLLAYEMVTGEAAFDGDSKREIMRKQSEADLPPLPEPVRDAPFGDFIRRATSISADGRFSNAGEARSWLRTRQRTETRRSDSDGSISTARPDDRTDDGRRPDASDLSERIDELPLIGRERAHDRAVDWLERATSTGGRLWILGDPGLGKTALLGSVLEAYRDRQPTILYSQCREQRSSIETLDRALHPLLDADPADLQPDAPKLAAAIRHARAEFNEEGRASETVGDDTGSGPMFDTAKDLVLAWSRERPTVLAIEDLQHVDGIGIGFLRSLEERARRTGAPLALVYTAPPRALRANPHSSTLLEGGAGRNREQWHADRIDLEPLDDADVRECLDELLPLAPEVRRSIVTKSDGNPLYLTQMVRHLVRRGLLERDGSGNWTPTDPELDLDEVVPTTLKALSVRRLRNIQGHPVWGEVAGALLFRLALLGERFDRRMVEDFLSREEYPQLERRLDELLDLLEDLGMIQPIDTSDEPAWRFVDDVFRQTLLDAFHPDRTSRSRLHQLAAETKIERRSRAPDALPSSGSAGIARHFEHAGRPRAAFRWWLRRAREAEREGDLREALRSHRSVLRLLEGNHGEEVDPSGEYELQVRLAEGRLRQRLGQFGPAEDALRAARKRAREADDRSVEARATRELGRALLGAANYDEAEEVFRRAAVLFDRLEADSETLECRAAVADVQRLRGNYTEAEKQYREVLWRVEGEPASEQRVRCLLGIGRCEMAAGELERAADVLTDAQTVASEAGAQGLQYRATLVLALVDLYRSGVDAARQRTSAVLDEIGESSERPDRALAHLVMGMCLRRTDELSRAAYHCGRARRLYERAGRQYGIAKCVLLEGEIAWMEGDLERAIERADDARELHERLDDRHGLALSMMYEARFLQSDGASERARELLLRSLAISGRTGLGLYRPFSLLFLGTVEQSDHELDKARMYFEEARSLAASHGNSEAELFAELHQAKLDLCVDEWSGGSERADRLHRQADEHGHAMAVAIAEGLRAWYASLTGDEKTLDRSVARLRRLEGGSGAPAPRLPERLFDLAQITPRKCAPERAAKIVASIEELMRALDRPELADRLGLQIRTLDVQQPGD